MADAPKQRIKCKICGGPHLVCGGEAKGQSWTRPTAPLKRPLLDRIANVRAKPPKKKGRK